MNDTEREIITLKTAWEMIDDMVNWAMFVKTDKAELSNLIFVTSHSARLFAILLGDFLSEIRSYKGALPPLGFKPVPSGVRPSDLTMLYHLRQVCSNPMLGGDPVPLSAATEAFADWLEGEFIAEGVNLGEIDVVADITVSRLRYLKMCGDIAKHNIARLSTNVGHLRALLEKAGHPVSEQEAYLAVDDFGKWFLNGIFSYHSSQICEYLNNIRWTIYDYLQPEFRRSWHLTEHATKDFRHYAYRVPAAIREPVAVAMYWDAMNRSRRCPYVQRFTIPGIYKKRY